MSPAALSASASASVTSVRLALMTLLGSQGGGKSDAPASWGTDAGRDLLALLQIRCNHSCNKTAIKQLCKALACTTNQFCSRRGYN